jgi:hypothetical protein
MSWTYDVYCHVKHPELRLVVRSGAQLPERAAKSSWQYTGQERAISRIEAAEIQRSGFSVSRPRISK